jgi:hypothetical protein
MASAIKSIQLVFSAQPIPIVFLVVNTIRTALTGYDSSGRASICVEFFSKKQHMHLVWFGVGAIAAAFLILIVLVWRNVKKQERIDKDREDHGW